MGDRLDRGEADGSNTDEPKREGVLQDALDRAMREKSHRTTTDGRRTGRSSLDSAFAYKWTCPLCGAAGTSLADTMEEEKRLVYNQAQSSLRSHIRTSMGDEHGPSSGYPDSFNPNTLAEHVELVGENAADHRSTQMQAPEEEPKQ